MKIEYPEHGINSFEDIENFVRPGTVDLIFLYQQVNLFDICIKGGKGRGYVQIIIHGSDETLPDIINELVQIRIGRPVFQTFKPLNAGIDSLQR